nr:MAG TPA: hypothetical protein [Caudoviricetes sp.]
MSYSHTLPLDKQTKLSYNFDIDTKIISKEA